MAKDSGMDTERWVEERMASLEAADWRPEPGRAWERVRARHEAGRARRKKLKWMAGAAAAASLWAMAGPAPGALAQKCLDCSVALWQELRPGAVKAELMPASERKAVPDFALADAEGRVVRLSELRGRVVLLSFWATWCGGCKVEIPWFMEFERRLGAKGLTVVGVSFDEEGWKVVRPFVAAKKMNYTVVVGGPELAARYGGVDALPVTMVLDREGRIAARHVGLAARGWYEAQIAAALGEGGAR